MGRLGAICSARCQKILRQWAYGHAHEVEVVDQQASSGQPLRRSGAQRQA